MKSQFEGIEKLEQLSKDEQEYLSTACTDFYRIIKALRGPFIELSKPFAGLRAAHGIENKPRNPSPQI